MTDYCETRLCRRKFLLEYFGEQYPSKCDGCDNCRNPKDTIDGREIAGKIVTCVSALGGKFGASHVADVICGSSNQKILAYRHNRNPAYNTGKQYSKVQWIGFIKELVRLGYLSVAGDKYPVITPNGRTKEIIFIQELRLTKPAGGETTFKPEIDDKYDVRLFQELRSLRKSIADANGWPPYVVFHDATLREMARTYPRTLSELSKISGVGKAKLEKYGGEFVGTINGYVKAEGIA